MRGLFLVAMIATHIAGAQAGCLPVTSNGIHGSDFARADVRWSKLPSALTLSPAPLAGTARIFTEQDLQRIARANGIEAGKVESLCFEIPVAPLAEAAVLAAMRLEVSGSTDIGIVELPQTPVPAGVVEFPRSGLTPLATGTDGIQMWRGYVRYFDTRRAAVWARVRISVHYTAVVAARNLTQNTLLSAADLRLEARTGPPLSEVGTDRMELAEGQILKRAVVSGSVIPLSALEPAPLVRRGDSVAIEIRSGLARLKLYAVAERSGAAGELIDFRNPTTGKAFRARVESSSSAVLEVPGGLN